MKNVKLEVYNILRTTGYAVLQQSQNTAITPPLITYYLLNMSVDMDLSGELASQDVSVSVDIWANTSTEASKILAKTEEAMRKGYWRMTNSLDVPNPDKTIYHMNATFTKIVA